MNFNVKCFKSIFKEQNIKLENKKLNIFIGQNGVGKTNVLEAIDWLINPSSKQVITEKNPYHKGDNNIIIPPKTETYMITDLTDTEKEEISGIFKKYNADLNFVKLNKIEYKNSTITGNQYSFDFKELKSAYKSLINQLLKTVYNNGNSWLMPEFFKKTIDGTGTLYYDNGLTEIQKMQINDDIKKKHSDLAEDIKTILTWAKEERECIYVKNADFENNLEYSYSFDQYKNGSNKEFIELLNFIEQNTDLFNNLDNLLKASNSQDEKEIIKSQNHLKKQIEDSSNSKIKELFNKFDIYAYPEIISADNKLSLIVKDKHNYKIGNEETKFNSSGYKAFFHLIIKAENIRRKARENEHSTFILLADEPDKNLHPNLQIQLINYLQNLCLEFPNIYIALTTHSPFILNEEKDFASIFSRPMKMICNYEKMTDSDKKIVNDFAEENGINITFYDSIIKNNLNSFINENNVDKIYNIKDLQSVYSKNDLLRDIENGSIILILKN